MFLILNVKINTCKNAVHMYVCMYICTRVRSMHTRLPAFQLTSKHRTFSTQTTVQFHARHG